jgi:outer membrane protein TolC
MTRFFKNPSLISLLALSLLQSVHIYAESAPETSHELRLSEALSRALGHNPNLAAERARMKSEKASIISKFSPPDPNIGYQELNRNVSTKYWSVSQKIDFPLVYYFLGRAQIHRGNSAKAQYHDRQLQIRAELITTYYALYSVKNILNLTDGNINSVREFARVAEKKYSGGQAPQQDSMRAHVELTQLQADLRVLKQEEAMLTARLKELLNEDQSYSFNFPKSKIDAPKLSVELSEIKDFQGSFTLAKQRKALKAAQAMSLKEKMEFVPDIGVRYQQSYAGLPNDSYILGIELSVPLYFWKQTGNARAASFKVEEQRAKLASLSNKLAARLEEVKARVTTQKELLAIYETGLIPQAKTAYNSTFAGYKSGRTSFTDLLDSERALFNVRIKYYRILTDYIAQATTLERITGRELLVTDQDGGNF